ncbi:DUF6302 family protein [Streptomyces sp. NPDC058701]|uniref:DUF6302 family protein n=1 Tax=Streptomyces sp. NPDC058701 TaxID=3346608 RepID=UPI00366401DA
MTVTLAPAHEAYDFDHYRGLLANPTVLDHSVAIMVFRAPLLAVAVGGPRRGGYFAASDVTIGLAVRDLLAGRYGFPNVRLRWSSFPDTCHGVQWGDAQPDSYDDRVRGEFFGYHEAAITAFVRSTDSCGRVAR